MASKNGMVRVMIRPGTMLTKKSQCHESTSVIHPPSVGPMVGARLLRRPRVAGIMARLFPVKSAYPVANTVGIIAPPTKPCIARATIIDWMLHAQPQAILERVNAAAEAVKSQRVEKARESQPESGIMTISAMR